MNPQDLDSFFSAVCTNLMLTPSPWRLEFFRTWASYEGTDAKWNPLATTQPGREDPANPYWNTFGQSGQYHVRNYASATAGVAQTVATLANGYYLDIIQALATEHVDSAAAAALRKWGTTGFAELIETGWGPDPVPPAQSLASLAETLRHVGIFEWAKGGYAPLLPTIQQLQIFDNELDRRLRALEGAPPASADAPSLDSLQ